MRWKVSMGLLGFAVMITALLGFAAGPALAGSNDSSFSFSIGSHHHSRRDRRPDYRHDWRHNRHHGRHGAFFTRHYWPQPWPIPAPPRVVYVEPPRIVVSPPAVTSPAPFCREFQKQIVIDGRTEQAYGLACLQPDGTWKIQP